MFREGITGNLPKKINWKNIRITLLEIGKLNCKNLNSLREFKSLTFIDKRIRRIVI